MKTYFDCIPCFLRQALSAARLISPDKNIHELVMRNVLRKTAEMDLNQPPPAMGRLIYQMVREISGNNDPYKSIKDKYNQFVLGLYPEFQKIILTADKPFEVAVRLAIAGNIIDFGVGSDIRTADVYDIVNQSITQELVGSIEKLEHAISAANKILYLGDNSGEIVFDRLLIEQLPREKITYAVRGYPIINDVTMADAEATGITDLVKVVDNGSDAPGTLLDQCSNEFCDIFAEADLIISKGQGNYESLSDTHKNIFFIFTVKCPVVASNTGHPKGSIVIIASEAALF
jgi:uncharacterized protein with ATP-grasp and redox domains